MQKRSFRVSICRHFIIIAVQRNEVNRGCEQAGIISSAIKTNKSEKIEINIQLL